MTSKSLPKNAGRCFSARGQPPHAEEPGRLTYQALIEEPSLLDKPMQVLTDDAAPWLIGMGRLAPRR